MSDATVINSWLKDMYDQTFLTRTGVGLETLEKWPNALELEKCTF